MSKITEFFFVFLSTIEYKLRGSFGGVCFRHADAPLTRKEGKRRRKFSPASLPLILTQ